MSMEDKDEKDAKTILALIILALWPVAAIIDGFVLKHLWAWFVVTTFNLPPIGIAQAIGIALIGMYITHQGSDYYDVERHGAVTVFERLVGRSLIAPWIILLCGVLVKGFLP